MKEAFGQFISLVGHAMLSNSKNQFNGWLWARLRGNKLESPKSHLSCKWSFVVSRQLWRYFFAFVEINSDTWFENEDQYLECCKKVEAFGHIKSFCRMFWSYKVAGPVLGCQSNVNYSLLTLCQFNITLFVKKYPLIGQFSKLKSISLWNC